MHHAVKHDGCNATMMATAMVRIESVKCTLWSVQNVTGMRKSPSGLVAIAQYTAAIVTAVWADALEADKANGQL